MGLRELLIRCCLVKCWAANLFSLTKVLSGSVSVVPGLVVHPKAYPGNHRLDYRCIVDPTRWEVMRFSISWILLVFICFRY